MHERTRIEILELERALLDPRTRHPAEWLDGVLAEDMIEFGKSGKIHGRDDIIRALVAETPPPAPRFEIVDPKLTEVAADVILLTYRLEPLPNDGKGAERSVASLRSSIWRRRDGRWQLCFHQGTVAA